MSGLHSSVCGVISEFIVAHTLGIADNGTRDEWAVYDLETESGIKIEVKSTAFIQSWHIKKSSIV